jgi:hypothetical protein
MNEEEKYLRTRLAELTRSYEVAAKPYVDRLVAIESCKPPRPIYLLVADLLPELLARLSK